MTDRAQAFTFEAITAALLLIGTVVFIAQAPGVSPLSSSTASQDIPTQQRDVASGLLDAAAHQDVIRPTLLYWDADNERFHGTDEEDEYYIDGGPPTAFGGMLNDSFTGRDAAFNVDITYSNESGGLETVPLVHQGSPTTEAAKVSRIITLYEDDVLYTSTENKSDIPLSSASSFYAPDTSPDNPVYNVIRLEVTVWRV